MRGWEKAEPASWGEGLDGISEGRTRLRTILLIGAGSAIAVLLLSCKTAPPSVARPKAVNTPGGEPVLIVAPDVKVPPTNSPAQESVYNFYEPPSLATNAVQRQYDTEFVHRVSARWSTLLRETGGDAPKGKTVLGFRLHPDGRVTNVEVLESSMDQKWNSICEKAVLDCVPFAAWSEEITGRFHSGLWEGHREGTLKPQSLRQGRESLPDYRQIRFTFYFN